LKQNNLDVFFEMALQQLWLACELKVVLPRWTGDSKLTFGFCRPTGFCSYHHRPQTGEIAR
jgi:hypothetical protein